MGELVYFKKKEQGLVARHLDSIVTAFGLVADEDFKIASILVLDQDYEVYSE